MRFSACKTIRMAILIILTEWLGQLPRITTSKQLSDYFPSHLQKQTQFSYP